ncbi:hypothetical protein NDU88_000427 [Pleurodeles waltl]|uniref:Uncharacterized protein n=1 Tax=Pleurodeles waltl TaxID=8319 RepID=A0AAV7TGC0_PLEWA|nr:hypothetical protein NDU88_000427 [Pleurodeles waltl]
MRRVLKRTCVESRRKQQTPGTASPTGSKGSEDVRQTEAADSGARRRALKCLHVESSPQAADSWDCEFHHE